MKWTTSNLKNPNYGENHELYVGTSIGTFKRFAPSLEEKPFLQRNLCDLSQLEKDDRVTALSFGNNTSEILIGRARQHVQLYSLQTEKVESTLNLKFSVIVGLARFGNYLAAGFSNGQVQRLSLENSSDDSEFLFRTGDEMSHLRQCLTNRNLIASGGKGRQNNLKIFDMEIDGKQIFSSKNLPNDYLQLEVPVWDSDVGFIDSPHILATCSRHGYVRVYDTRKQRRPVQCYATEDRMSFSTLVAHGNFIYTGTTMGAMKAFDIRRMKTFVHTYKGFTGGVTDVSLDSTGKYLASASLDRYVRVHHVDSTVLLYQCYVKSKATRVLIRETTGNAKLEATDSEVDKDENTNSKGAYQEVKDSGEEDKEYEEIFENMQTVCESCDEDSEDETKSCGGTENASNAGSKRKSGKEHGETKKKKT